MKIKKLHKTLLIAFLATLSAFAPFSTDIYLASMPTIKQSFNTSAGQVQLTLSLYFISYALGQLAWGPISDKVGRKPALFIGLIIFLAGSLLSAFSTSINMLIISRVIQGIGACAGIVTAMAMVKDIFLDHTEMVKILSTMTSIMLLAPIIAPIIGGYLLVHFNWQSNFYFLTAYGVALFIANCFVKESHPKATRKPLAISKLYHTYLTQLLHKPFLLNTLAVSTNFCMLFSFIASASFIYIGIYHIPTEQFGYFFAFNAIALIIGSTSTKFLQNQLKIKTLINLGLGTAFIGTLAMLICIPIFAKSPWGLAAPLFIGAYGIGMLFPLLMSEALKHVVDYTGIASSLLGAIRFVLAAGVGLLMGTLIKQSALPLAITMLVLFLLTCLFIILNRRA